jgi:hypothetical protein
MNPTRKIPGVRFSLRIILYERIMSQVRANAIIVACSRAYCPSFLLKLY